MKKGQKESSAWKEIDRHTGRNVLPDGERVRPLYLGDLVSLRSTAELTLEHFGRKRKEKATGPLSPANST